MAEPLPAEQLGLDPLPTAWTTPEVRGPARQPEAPAPTAHAPSPGELLVYCLRLSAAQAEFAENVRNFEITVRRAAWSTTEGADRFLEWYRVNQAALQSGAICAGYLAGLAKE